jgi:hypothetical protein
MNRTQNSDNLSPKKGKDPKGKHQGHSKQQSSPPLKYYHEKFQMVERMSILDRKPSREYFSSFKTISRDKRDYEENVGFTLYNNAFVYRK